MSSPTNADELTWRVTFSEAVENVDAADFEVSGTVATLTVVAVSSSSLAYDVTAGRQCACQTNPGGGLASLTGTVTLSFSTGHNIADTAGYALVNIAPTDRNETSYVVDHTAPNAEISGVPDTSTGVFTATITFTEGVKGFAVEDIAVGNGTAAAFTGSEGGREFTALITPTGDGTVTVDVAANAATDTAGNGNLPAARVSSSYVAVLTDTIAPTVVSITRQIPLSSPTNANTLTWRVIFSEDVVNVDAADFEVSGTVATLTVVAVSSSSLAYDVTVSGGSASPRTRTSPTGTATPCRTLSQRARMTLPLWSTISRPRWITGVPDISTGAFTATLEFAADQNITDRDGDTLSNTAPTGANDVTFVVDNIAPTVYDVTITGVPDISTGAFTATFTFLEAVNGFVVGDITVNNGAASDFTMTDAMTYTATITPAGDGAVTVDVAANVATDAAGNGNTEAAQASSVHDATAPRVVSIVHQDPASTPTNANSLTWRVTFSEDVAKVDAADFAVAGTTVAPTVSEVTASTVYDVTVSGGDLANLNATVTLAFVNGQNIADTAGNALVDSVPTGENDSSYVVDNVAPTVTIGDVPTGSNASFTATFTFLEAVNGFVVGDITVNNGAASDFTMTDAMTYTATITPAGDGAVTVDVAANVATDAAGNGNTEAAQASSVYDATAPRVVSIVHQDPASTPTNADSLTWRVTFSEDVANVDAADFAVAGTTVAPTVSEVTASTVYDVTVSGGDLANLNAMVTLAFANGHDIADTTGNALVDSVPTGENDNSYFVDNIAPTVTIGDVPTGSNASFTATFTFLEAVNGFVVGDITVNNGAASDFTMTDAMTYTATITPAGDGAVTVDVAANVATDAAGNGNTEAAQASSVHDATAPRVVSIVHQDPASTPTNANSLTWRVTFSEDVANVDAADFAVAGTTVAPTVSEVTASTVYDVTVSGGDLANLNATVTLAFANGHDIADTTGNALVDSVPTGENDNSYFVDNIAPTVTIGDVPTGSNASFTARFTFLEAVNGFVVGDITVNNGAASDFTMTDAMTYTATITPAGDGAVTVDVAANVATDAAGNGNTEAAQASSVHDATAPRVVSIVHQDPASTPTNANSLTWRVTFSEDVANVDAADFAVAGTTVAPTVSEVTASTVYDVTVSGGDLANLNATVTLAFANGHDIADTTGNALVDSVPTGGERQQLCRGQRRADGDDRGCSHREQCVLHCDVHLPGGGERIRGGGHHGE